VKRLAVAAAALALVGCGGGPRVTETRAVAPFQRIEVADGVEVRVVRGSGTEVRVRAGKDVMERVGTESSGGLLRLELHDRGIVIGPDPLADVRMEVGAASLDELRIVGSGDVTLAGVDEDALALAVEGSGEIEAAGRVDRLTATIEGAGTAHLSDLEARAARVVVEGSGDVDLNVREELDVVVEGAGDVSYRGDPNVESEISGAGDISRDGSP
jgi:Putative auto-transporter adhesin, head GIN domain